ncbi:MULTISPECIES: type III secretion system needle length determinant [Vibrio]|uniref:type III secretion system needle length determinant n=1 Tax=Vibrio TaxID=662 RepID=UPI001A8E3F40|nr:MULTISPECIES: type III secretion system needle length determinant [Vibrio]EJX1245616.1 type III secretion system needle length determinant [Vibrio alginolyticus]MBO0138228.1 type III secretion system needle length determinant [Vibrio sp. Vb2736]MBS9824158.1 type III secretion system needle length determinant [Vibrio alginolyticus]MBS9902584.1 type III secretion system needle length determinant [Vibrio alginolyticus]MCA2419557.1 type III secretion system needle length determinant [Vibrio alg
MRITPTTETSNTLHKSTPEQVPLEKEAELQSQFEHAMTKKPSKGKESIVANPQKNHTGEEDIPLRHKTSQGLDKKLNLSNQEANADKNTSTLKGKSDVVTKRDIEKPQDDAANSEEIISENNKLLKNDGKSDGDTVLSSPSTERVDPHFQAQAHLKDDKPTPMDKHTSPDCLSTLESGLLPQSATETELAQYGINIVGLTKKQTEKTHNKRATPSLQNTGKRPDQTGGLPETKPLEKIETKSALFAVKTDEEKVPSQPFASAVTQGDVILKSVASQAQPSPTRDVNQLLQQLVDKIYVALPTASDNKEVRLFLSEGQLKGGEIHIKLDAQGYSVTIRQEHALSIISQQARQDLAERLNRFGGEQPLRLAISEQTQQLDQQQHEQQHSRQQRSVYEEWQAENDL